MHLSNFFKRLVPITLVVACTFVANAQERRTSKTHKFNKSVNRNGNKGANKGTIKSEEGYTLIDLGANAYVTSGTGVKVSNEGITSWKNEKDKVSAYFHLAEPKRKVRVVIKASGKSVIKVTISNKDYLVKLDSDDLKLYKVAEVNIPSGYQRVDFQGVEERNGSFGTVTQLLLKDVEGSINFVRNFDPYWGRRGPSVHMGYAFPTKEKIEYFYNEVTVPKGEDQLATYFMACGFGEGYFGMQVNSPKERRVLFSVWSPFETQNPAEIPADMQIKMLRRGEDVNIGEFGNEGSGGQSFLRFPWIAGNTYRFLQHVHPDGKGNTIYTAYFFAPETNKWRLIASFLRPKTNTYYTNAHSFLENFSTHMGYVPRTVFFGNQWVKDVNGKWHELTNGTFTCDNTGRAKVRLDYSGGLSANKKMFYLKNCGFTNDYVPADTKFTREPSGKPAPKIDFSALEKL